MSRRTITTVAIALTLAAGAAFADDSSMSQWTGESYKAFEASKSNNGAPASAESRKLNATPDNGTSIWNGDSYAAFEHERTSPPAVTMSIAEANKERAAASRERPAHTAQRGRTPTNPFRDDTA
jgi:hypothetical protein